MKTTLLLLALASVIGCSKPKPQPQQATATTNTSAIPCTPVNMCVTVSEPEWAATLRSRAAKRNLRWTEVAYSQEIDPPSCLISSSKGCLVMLEANGEPFCFSIVNGVLVRQPCRAPSIEESRLPITTRRPFWPLQEAREPLHIRFASSHVADYYAMDHDRPPPQWDDAPAITQKVLTRHAGDYFACGNLNLCSASEDQYEDRPTCADKSRILLQSVDGKWHCIKFGGN